MERGNELLVIHSTVLDGASIYAWYPTNTPKSHVAGYPTSAAETLDAIRSPSIDEVPLACAQFMTDEGFLESVGGAVNFESRTQGLFYYSRYS